MNISNNEQTGIITLWFCFIFILCFINCLNSCAKEDSIQIGEGVSMFVHKGYEVQYNSQTTGTLTTANIKIQKTK